MLHVWYMQRREFMVFFLQSFPDFNICYFSMVKIVKLDGATIGFYVRKIIKTYVDNCCAVMGFSKI